MVSLRICMGSMYIYVMCCSLLWLRATCVKHFHYTPCYSDYCFCHATTANCSYNGNDLRTIPKVTWRNITNYYFTYNNVTAITRNTFKNIKSFNIQVLDLRGNHIKRISKDAFLTLHNLHHLFLDRNVIPANDLQLAFTSMSSLLSYLHLNYMGLTTLPENFFYHLKRTMLTGIHMTHNNFTTFNTSVLRYTRHVTTLKLEHNRISSLDLVYLETLGSLWMGNNALNELPDMCQLNTTIFPQLWNLGLENNNITSLDAVRFSCLKELRLMNISRNNFTHIHTDTFSGLEKLQTLDISDNERPIGIHARAFGNKELKSVNLSSSVQYINKGAFKGCLSLNMVDLSNSDTSTYDLWFLLSHLNLITLVCNNCKLYKIPDLIKKMANLEVLNLDGNRINVIPHYFFKVNTKLRILTLSHNELHTVSDFAITYSLLLTLKYINLENNPFNCNCSLLWLKDWIMDDTEMFQDQWTNYTCASPVQCEGHRLVDVGFVSNQVCMHAPYTVVLCSVGTVFIVILLLALIYKWRWSLRYCCMERRSDITFADESSPLLQNDAYVVYCKDDYPWVRYQVMPNLEENGSFKLGIKQRDFNDKLHLVDNIVDNLRRCKKVMVVLSNNFLRDGECQFELTLVRKKLENQDGCLVVVLLEVIEDRYRSASVDALMKSCALFVWPENSANRDSFWIDLVSSLQGIPLQAVV